MRDPSFLPLAGLLLVALGVTACSSVVEPGGAGGGASSSASTGSGCGPACEKVAPWSVRYEDEGGLATALGVATDAAGNVFATGVVGPGVDFGTGSALPSMYGGNYLLELDPAGKVVFARMLDDRASAAEGADVAVDAAGSVYVVGSFDAFGPPLDLGSGPLVSAGGTDVFLVKLDAGGHPLWSVRYGTLGVETPVHLAVGPWGEVAVVGAFIDEAAHTLGTFLAAFGPEGQLLWDRRVPTGTFDTSGGVAIDGDGNVVITGSVDGQPDFGMGPLGAPAPMFGAMYDVSGLLRWSWPLGGAGTARPGGVAFDAAGNVVLTGVANGDVDFGGGPLGGPENQAFLAKLDHDGMHLWSEALWVSYQYGIGAGIAVTADGGVVAAGSGGPALDGTTSVPVRLLDADGKVRHQHDYRMPLGSTQNVALAVEPNGDVVMAGSYTGTLDLGSGQLEATLQDVDIFVARLTP